MSKILNKIRSAFPVTDRILESCNIGIRDNHEGFVVLVYIQNGKIAMHLRTETGLKKII